jgi:nucleotide-binding universal stress UspA family protein
MSMPVTVPPSWTLTSRRRGNVVVVGYDRSHAARAALREAARRAGPEGRLVVVYATSSPDALFDPAGYEGVMGAHDRDLRQIREDVAEIDVGDAIVEVLLARKPVAETLVGMGRAFEADEIVLGLPRRGRLRSLLRRSVAKAILRISDRPVVVVPEPVEDDEAAPRR